MRTHEQHRFCGLTASLLLAAIWTGAADNPFTSPRLAPTVSWLGNTFPGAERWVPQDIGALCVAPDGRVFSNVHWEEGGGNCTAFKDGEVLGHAGHTHGWGHQGGHAVAANARHLFIAGRMGNEGGNLKDPETWPPKDADWVGISRRTLEDIRKAAPFPGAKGGKGGTLKSAFLVVDEVPVARHANERRGSNITGLCATDSSLFASCPYDRTIKVFDADTMQRAAVWPFERAGPLALAPDGTLWVLQEAAPGLPARVLALDGEGRPQPREVRFDARDTPVAIAFTPEGRLLVADSGPLQQVRLFDVRSPTPRQTGALGVEGGITSGHSGTFGPLRFNQPRAVACDSQGTVFVAHGGSTGGGSTVLEAYAPHGKRLWHLLGLMFVDLADVDPADDTRVFSKEERFAMDYTQPRGREWAYRGYTVNRFRYPEDPRLHIWSAGAWVRRIGGRPFLFVTDMNAEHLQVFRFSTPTDGETAIPSGLFAKRRIAKDGWPPHQPEKGEWLWRDADGNGTFGPDEFTPGGGADAPASQGWWADHAGGVWLASETRGIRYFPQQGLDACGNPQWSYATARTFPHPQGFRQLKRLRYDPSSDTLYLGGTTDAHRNQHWKPMGPFLARYDGWLKSEGRDAPRWQIVLPYGAGAQGHASCEPMGFDTAGDFLFVPYTGAAKALGVKTGRVEVFRAADGAACGHFEPSPDIGEIGLQDIRESLRAHRRADGEYLVFLEDDYKAKVVLYRWRPAAPSAEGSTAK